MKKKFPLRILAAITLFSAFAVTTGTLSWFIPLARVNKTDNPLTGSSSGAYFAYGNGTPSTPESPDDRVYGITVPRHLYNLAWLQYLGFFNLAEENGKQYYFELGDNIDMTGWVLPPIGTEDNPFIGNFNGNGYVIKGLTVSNKFSDFQRHPGVVTSGNFNQPHILGFFGVIGDYNNTYTASSDYSSAANEFCNTGLTGLTIKTYLKDSLMGVAAGYVSGNMKNVAVDASTINLDSSINEATTPYKTFENISDFSLVGYTTHEKQLKKVDETIYDITVSPGHEFNATEQSDGGSGWGGSINMLNLYKRLLYIQNNGTTSNTTYTYRTSTTYNADGSVRSGPTNSTANSWSDSDLSSTQFNNRRYTSSSSAKIGNFNFFKRGGTYGNKYVYLSGGKLVYNQYYSYYTHEGHFITDGTHFLSISGTQIQNNITSSASASIWTTPNVGSTGTIYTTYDGTTYYLRNNNGTLELYNGTSSTYRTQWTVATSGTGIKITNGTYELDYYDNAWTLIQPGQTLYTLLSDGNGHYIGQWGANGTSQSISAVTEANAAHFLSDTNGYYYMNGTAKYYIGVYHNNNTTTQYLRATDSTSRFLRYNKYNNTNYLYGQRTSGNGNNRQYYTYTLRYNNGNWTSNRVNQTGSYIAPSSSNATAITFTDVSTPSNLVLVNYTNNNQTREGPDSYLDSNRDDAHMEYSSTDTTYFPLNVATDGETTSTTQMLTDYAPTDGNSGYVVTGSGIDKTATMTRNASLLRVSYYDITEIGTSYSSSDTAINKTKVYTITSSGTSTTQTTIQSQINNGVVYEKYDDSSDTLYTKALKNQSNIYGMHFMSSKISMDDIVEAQNISILGKSYTGTNTYQLPVNSIDFHLKEKGYINFFAGTYYGGNDSFFSLHHIFRDGNNDISEIKEIKEIYGNTSKSNYSYAFKYTDGTYLKPYRFDANQNKYELSANDQGTTAYQEDHNYSESDFNALKTAYGYAKLFDTDCITNYKTNSNGTRSKILTLTDNALYYFEIPINEGEFCLGSVDGGVGSYLIYLDIAANASKYERTIFTEHLTAAETVTIYPDGVALVSLPESYQKEVPTLSITTEIDYTDSACVEIRGGYTNSFTIDRNSNDVTLTRTNQSNAPPIYRGEKITKVHDSGSSTDLTVVPFSSSTKDIKRLTYYDVNVNMQTLTTTIITDTSENNGAVVRTIVQTNYNSLDPTETPASTYVYNSSTDQRTSMKIYNTNNGVRYTAAEIVSTTILPIGTVSSNALLTARIIQDGGSGFSEDYLIKASIDSNNTTGKYYKFDDYLITITPSGANVVVHVITYSNSKSVHYGSTQVTGGNQDITIAA